MEPTADPSQSPTQAGPPPIPPPASVPYYAPGAGPPPGQGWPPASPYDMAVARAAQDDAHLRTLSICHYVIAGLLFLFSFLFAFYIWFGLMIESGGLGPPSKGNPPPPQGFGYIFATIGTLGILFHWVQAACACVSARNLSRRRGRTFTLVTAGLLCLQMPLGTVLGVFTFIVLARDSVRAAYEQSAAGRK